MATYTLKSVRRKIRILEKQIELLQAREELKKKGDFHIANVFRVWKTWVDKSSPYRDAVKKLIFGILYGKGARTLAKDIDKPLEEAEEIIQKLFDEFPDGAAWLEDAVKQVNKYGHVMSPIGRVRRLFRVFTGKRGVIAAAGRRAQNSPIQGFASEIGCTAAFLILLHSYEFIKKMGWSFEECMPKYSRAVHDANYFFVPYKFIIPFIHIKQYVATNGVTDWYKEVFDLDFTIEPEIELEVAATEDNSYKWLWEIPDLLSIIHRSLSDMVKLGQLPAEDLKQTYMLVTEPWRDPELRTLLQSKYPLLNVKELDSQIVNSVAIMDDLLFKKETA